MAKHPRQHEQRFFYLAMVSRNEQWRLALVDAPLQCWPLAWTSSTHRTTVVLRAASSNQARESSLQNTPLGVKPDNGNFPARNRIISGLSLGVLVAEAPTRSGALITAGFALKQGRDVFGIPGSILSSKSSGVNKLTQEDAKPVMDVKDILESVMNFW